MQFRVAFDPSLPVVAAQAFTAEGRSFADGDPFDWRAMGLSEETLQALWMAGHVAFVPPPADGKPHLATFHAAPGETVHVAAPEQRKKQPQPRR